MLGRIIEYVLETLVTIKSLVELDFTPFLAIVFGFTITVIVAILGFRHGWIKRVWDRLKRKSQTLSLKVKRIDSETDEDIYPLMRLHRHTFPDEKISDSDENILRWLREIKNTRGGQDPCDDIFLIVKRRFRRDVVAYTYATCYRSLGFLFISYIAVDTTFADAERQRGNKGLSSQITEYAVRLLLDKLGRLTGFPDQLNGVVAEIAHDRKKDILSTLFSIYAVKLQVKIYKIDIEYLQPALEVDDKGEQIDQDLILVPGRKYQEMINDNPEGRVLDRRFVLNILNFVYLHLYADSYKWTPYYYEYLDYLKSLLTRYEAELDKIVRLQPLRPTSLRNRKPHNHPRPDPTDNPIIKPRPYGLA
jgi:hypothetical protein